MASTSQWLNRILDKTIDPIAENFIIAAYSFGCSAQLIQRNLRENSYNPTIKEIQTVLKQNNIHDDGSNCSRQSHIWKRYLTYIADKFDPSSLAQFKREGLNEATTFYGIDEETVTNYWFQLLEFQTSAPLGSRLHENFENRFGPWIVSAFLEFGYNSHSLHNYLAKSGFNIPRIKLSQIFNEVASNTNLDKELVIIFGPKISPYSETTTAFWKAGYALLRDFGIPQIIEMTEIIGGYRVELVNIRFGH